MIIVLNGNNNLKEYIEDTIKEIKVYSHYFGYSINEIQDAIKYSIKLHNTLREDNNPSLSFYVTKYSNGYVKLKIKDWAEDAFSGDIYDLVGLIYNLDPNEPTSFYEICSNIVRDVTENISVNVDNIEYSITERSRVEHKFTYRNFNNNDFTYWCKYGFKGSYIKTKYLAIQTISDIKNNIIYKYSRLDPAYIYTIGIKDDVLLYKVIFPFRQRFRFITNNSFPLECLHEVSSETSNLIIIKSRKDSLTLRRILELANKRVASDTSIVNLSNEVVKIPFNIGNKLASNYDKVFIFNDFDKTGIYNSFYHNRVFNYIPIFLSNIYIKEYAFEERIIIRLCNSINRVKPNSVDINSFYDFVNMYNKRNYYAKDISDFVVKFGDNKTIKLIDNVINHYDL